jgi:hypothetical protein
MPPSDRRFGRRQAQGDDSRAEPKLSFSPRGGEREREERAPALGRKAKTQAEPVIAEADRPIHLRDDAKGGRAFGWVALAAMLVIVGGVYAWHFDTPAPSAPVQGYTTPQQATPSEAATAPANPSPAQALGAAGQVTTPTAAAPAEPATQSVATAPEPKSLPPTPTEAPHKTISEAAAANPLTTKTPPAAEPATTAPAPAAKPRKDAALDLPKPRPAVAAAAPPMPNLPPAAPAAATGTPQPLTRAAAPANQNAATTPSLTPFLHPAAPTPAAAPAPVPGTSATTVTVDGVTYVDGQQPHALGTLAAPSLDATNAPTPLAPTSRTAPSGNAAPYAPSNGGAALPNDVIISPNGQMSVPSNAQ